MADSTDDIYALQAKITQQASSIKAMKKEGKATAAEIMEEVTKLTELREQLATINKSIEPENIFNRKSFDELLLRKMYVVSSFEIHNGPAGLFDYGPPACSLKANVLSHWRRHFVLEENMLEMECTNLTPSVVLETSGHVERFTDFMVRDEVTQECFRADKLLEDAIDQLLMSSQETMPLHEQEEHKKIQRQADAFSAEELYAMLLKYNVKSPPTGTNPGGNALTQPFPFNLMFKTTIGPEGTSVGYLRPETAQGLFVNFRRLLDYNQQKMPFAAAQIGLGFRNEIAPRQGLIRVREFCMAEIEHFVDPADKSHPSFADCKDVELCLFSADAQLGTGRTVQMTIGAAVHAGVVNNETLGYFMARTQLFLVKIGVDPARMRFRQHLKTEMAHYAADCWDMEIQMSYGWIECVGHADRACYDLQQHSQKSGVPMVASKRLAAPVKVNRLVLEPNKKLIGPRFKGEQKNVLQAIEALAADTSAAAEGSAEDVKVLEEFKAALERDGKATLPNTSYELTPDLVTFKSEEKTISELKYTPSVIEPSFGIGRIMYAVLEHAFSQRDGDEQRCVMSFRPCVAPIKVGIYRLLNHGPFDAVVAKLRSMCQSADLPNRVDSSSGTVGRRYSRADELGIPFGITVDFQTLLDRTVTVRDRDSMAQIRVPISGANGVISLLLQLVSEVITWAEAMDRYVVVNAGGSDASDGDEQQQQQEPQKEGEREGKTLVSSSSASVLVERTTRGTFSVPNTANATIKS